MAFLDTADSKHAAPSDAVSSTAGGKSHEKKTGSSDSPIFRLPAEIRNMIWQYVVDGHGKIIRVGRKKKDARTQQRGRLALALTCRQVQNEASLMYFACNTFVLRARHRSHCFRVIEPAANWLYELLEEERKALEKVVICCKTDVPLLLMQHAWSFAEALGMGFGFKVVGKLDKEVEEKKVHMGIERTVKRMVESWDCEHGKDCSGSHFELARPKPKAKGSEKKRL